MIENLRIVSLEEAQNTLPQLVDNLKTELQPLLIGPVEQPELALMPIETYSILEAALDYLVAKELAEDFEAWMDDSPSSLRVLPAPNSLNN
jgi:PHD/YefM family antitoxin component YafN of YafNO toxin-antitoxin module